MLAQRRHPLIRRKPYGARRFAFPPYALLSRAGVYARTITGCFPVVLAKAGTHNPVAYCRQHAHARMMKYHGTGIEKSPANCGVRMGLRCREGDGKDYS
jgi:hypothetical protein